MYYEYNIKEMKNVSQIKIPVFVARHFQMNGVDQPMSSEIKVWRLMLESSLSDIDSHARVSPF